MEILLLPVNVSMVTKVPTVKCMITVTTRTVMGGARVTMVHVVTPVTVSLVS